MTTIIDPDMTRRALFLYQDSRTGRTDRGLRALRRLWGMEHDKFQWSSHLPLRPTGWLETLFGTVPPPAFLTFDEQAFYDGNRIVVDSRFLEHPQPMVMLSLQLSHEGVHMVLWDQPNVEQELHAHRNEVEYYRELRAGTRPILRESQEDQELASRKINQGTLVDFYVQKFQRDASAVPIDGTWVLRHIRYWGGIPRRESNTKIIYMSILKRDWDRLSVSEARQVFLELAESMEKRPPLRPDTVDWLRSAFNGATPAQLRRLQRIGERWQIHL